MLCPFWSSAYTRSCQAERSAWWKTYDNYGAGNVNYNYSPKTSVRQPKITPQKPYQQYQDRNLTYAMESPLLCHKWRQKPHMQYQALNTYSTSRE